jgi:hypothetical protein
MDAFTEEIIKKEIDGKIQAIHEYDNMLWKLRIGFLTLFFAGWGLLLNSLTGSKPGPGNELLIALNTILLVMASITLVICIGGFLIDLNYVRRKYRVIHALDLLYDRIFSSEKHKDLKTKQLVDLIQISGSRANTLYRKCTGYPIERMITLLIYFMPLLSMVIGIALLWK